ncbi:LOW QUALITY PROTEIN: heat shock protein 26 [Drosophila tropicalis]|uniref:LOW QUALITY PROTEIN: heat shock protein 26 n=1 Tax=Drosophila tropicalis TaxID=46794 RepID=UPI0035AB81F2
MSLSQLISLVDEMQEPRSPMYEFGLGMRQPRYLQSWVTPHRLAVNEHGCPCASPVCPVSPAAQILASRQRNRELAKHTLEHWPLYPQVGKDGFQVCMDVSQFKPSELNVKIVDNKTIVVEGKHEEREDEHGHIMRHFVRRYTVPEGYEADRVASSLSSDGVLNIVIPKPQPLTDNTKERTIQIQQVGPAHLNIKQNRPEDSDKEIKSKVTNGSAQK